MHVSVYYGSHDVVVVEVEHCTTTDTISFDKWALMGKYPYQYYFITIVLFEVVLNVFCVGIMCGC